MGSAEHLGDFLKFITVSRKSPFFYIDSINLSINFSYDVISSSIQENGSEEIFQGNNYLLTYNILNQMKRYQNNLNHFYQAKQNQLN